MVLGSLVASLLEMTAVGKKVTFWEKVTFHQYSRAGGHRCEIMDDVFNHLSGR
jgi:hypothetical protein